MTIPKSSLIVQLIAVADTYCAAREVSRSSVSKILLHRSSLLSDMEEGSRDLATGNFERCMQWFSENWPEEVAWPDGVDRPQPEGTATGDAAHPAARCA